MPAVVPFIPLIVGAFTVGESLYQMASQPGAPKPNPAGEQQPTTNPAGEKQSFFQAAPSVQERLGGSVSPDFFASEVARVSGNPGDAELAKQTLSQLLGLGSTPETQGTAAGSSNFGSGIPNFSPFNVNPTSGGGGQSPFGGGGVGPNFFESLIPQMQQDQQSPGVSGGYS